MRGESTNGAGHGSCGGPAARRRRQSGRPLIGGALCALLVTTAVPPSWAASAADTSPTPVVGDFALGDGLEGVLDPRDGSFAFTVDVGGLTARWESRSVGADPHGIGSGWSWEVGRIDTAGGVRVRPSSGRGPFEPDPSQVSGLAGYGLEDVRFEEREGMLPAREAGAGAAVGWAPNAPVGYGFVLHELGGVVTYFAADGDPVAQVDAFGARVEWVWDARVPHRLLGVIDADGVATALDWASDPAAVLISPAVNLPDPVDGDGPAAGSGAGVWRMELGEGRVTAVVDPLGGRTSFGAEPRTGLLDTIRGPSGGVTRVSWSAGHDGVVRVGRVAVTDASGAVLSAREWAPVGPALASGWPAYAGEEALFWSGDSGFRYRTMLSDGATEVVSEFNSLHALVGRRLLVAGPSGGGVLQEHRFVYPGTDDGGTPSPWALPANWSRPTVTAVTHHDLHGGTRTTSEQTVFDDFGRLVMRTAHDGTQTETEYDGEVPEAASLPSGLAVLQTARATDGQVQVRRHTLNHARTAVIATETLSATDGSTEPEVVGRTEFDVDPHGRVTEQRVFPSGDRAEGPVVTRWREVVDLASGTRTRAETVGVGTQAEATTTEVVSLADGGVVAAIDALGNAGRARYDRLGRVVEATDAAGRMTISRYETVQHHGRNATIVRTPEGVERTEVRDELGRTIRVSDNIDRGRAVDRHARTVETREYPEPGLTVVTDAWGARTSVRSDVFGRAVETITATGLVQLMVPDDVANSVTTALTPTGSLGDAEFVRTEQRDEAGRAVAQSGARADGAPVPTVQHAFDGFGRALRSETATGVVTNVYDGHGRPVRTERAPADGVGSSIVAERRFDAHGNPVEQVLSDPTTSRSGGTRVLDALGRTVSATDQVGGVMTYEYTIDGLVSRATSRYGQRTEHVYDPIRRTLTGTTVESPIGPPVRRAVELDPVTDAVVAVFDPDDRAGTALTYTYDAWGNQTSVTYPDGSRITSHYDEHGRRTGLTDVMGHRTEYAHTADGRLTGATQRTDDGALLAEVTYEHDTYGRVVAIERGNRVRTEYTFTSASEIATETTTFEGAPLTRRTYEYDADGRLTRRTDTDFTETHFTDTDTEVDAGENPSARTTTAYLYDAHDRLIRSTEHDGADDAAPAAKLTSYELSVSGDLRTETVITAQGAPHEQTTRREFEYTPLGGLHAITTTGSRPGAPDTVHTATQDYDAAGNLTRAVDGTTVAYDALNRPVTESRADGTTITSGYWADGARRDLTRLNDSRSSPEPTIFYWDGGVLVNDAHEGAESGVAGYLFGDGRHSRTVVGADGAESTGYFVTDRHGSVTELTGADGAVVERYRYSDYGVPLTEHAWAGLGANPFGYAGEYTNPSGSQWLDVRTYDPATARFTTMDTAELHNLYAYADANPITRIDPTGRAGLDDAGHWVLAGLGIAFGVGTAIWTLATAGATVPVLGMFAATIFDAFVTVANTVNEQHTRFMPVSVGFVLGFAATAASLVTAKWVGGGKTDALKRRASTDVEDLHLATEQELAFPAAEVDFSGGFRVFTHDSTIRRLAEPFVTELDGLIRDALRIAGKPGERPTRDMALSFQIGRWEQMLERVKKYAAKVEDFVSGAGIAGVSRAGLWNEVSNYAHLSVDAVRRIRHLVFTTNDGFDPFAPRHAAAILEYGAGYLAKVANAANRKSARELDFAELAVANEATRLSERLSYWARALELTNPLARRFG